MVSPLVVRIEQGFDFKGLVPNLLHVAVGKANSPPPQMSLMAMRTTNMQVGACIYLVILESPDDKDILENIVLIKW